MKVAFLQGLPPERQEKLFEVWLRLREDPSGAYTGDMIAQTIIDRIQAGEGAAPPQWYRRYRLSSRRISRSRPARHPREGARRAVQKTLLAA
jgi:hypothetical protein